MRGGGITRSSVLLGGTSALAVGLIVWAGVLFFRGQAPQQAGILPVPATLQQAAAVPRTPGRPAHGTPAPTPTLPADVARQVAAEEVRLPAARQLVPAHLFIPALGVNAVTTAAPTAIAYDPFLGRKVRVYPVPADPYSTTWWSSGPEPGAKGVAIITGHHEIGGYGVFNELDKRSANGSYALVGADVVLESADRHVLHLTVTGVTAGISKSDPTGLSDAIAHAPAGTRAILITCAGVVVTSRDSHQDNAVAYLA